MDWNKKISTYCRKCGEVICKCKNENTMDRKGFFKIEQIYGSVQRGDKSMSKAREETRDLVAKLIVFTNREFYGTGGLWFRRGTTTETVKCYTEFDIINEWLKSPHECDHICADGKN